MGGLPFCFVAKGDLSRMIIFSAGPIPEKIRPNFDRIFSEEETASEGACIHMVGCLICWVKLCCGNTTHTAGVDTCNHPSYLYARAGESGRSRGRRAGTFGRVLISCQCITTTHSSTHVCHAHARTNFLFLSVPLPYRLKASRI